MSKECVRLIDNKFYLNDGGLSLQFNNNTHQLYISHYLLNNQYRIYNTSEGSIQQGLDIENFNNMKIPIPKSQDLLDEWTAKITDPYNKVIHYKNLIKRYEQRIKDEVQRIIDEEDCDNYKLGDICQIKYGDRIVKSKNGISDDYNDIKYPVIGGGDITFYTNKFNRSGLTLVISRFGISKKCARLINYKFFLNDSGLSLQFNDNTIKTYISYFMLNNQIKIYNSSNQSNQKNLDIDSFKNILIPIPKNYSLINKLNIIYNKIDVFHNKVNHYNKLYQMYIDELKEDIDWKEYNPTEIQYNDSSVKNIDDIQVEEENSPIKFQYNKSLIKDLNINDLQSQVDDEDEKIRLTDEECIDIIESCLNKYNLSN
jgi:restriction endonuclease S subunit